MPTPHSSNIHFNLLLLNQQNVTTETGVCTKVKCVVTLHE